MATHFSGHQLWPRQVDLESTALPCHLLRTVPAAAPLPFLSLYDWPAPSQGNLGGVGPLAAQFPAVGAFPHCSKSTFLPLNWCGRWYSRIEPQFIFDSKGHRTSAERLLIGAAGLEHEAAKPTGFGTHTT